MYNSFPDAPNFGPYVSPWVTVSSDNNPGEAVFMELAAALQMTEPPTPLTEIFPEETIEQRIVVIEQRFEGTDTIFPLVEPGRGSRLSTSHSASDDGSASVHSGFGGVFSGQAELHAAPRYDERADGPC